MFTKERGGLLLFHDVDLVFSGYIMVVIVANTREREREKSLGKFKDTFFLCRER